MSPFFNTHIWLYWIIRLALTSLREPAHLSCLRISMTSMLECPQKLTCPEIFSWSNIQVEIHLERDLICRVLILMDQLILCKYIKLYSNFLLFCKRLEINGDLCNDMREGKKKNGCQLKVWKLFLLQLLLLALALQSKSQQAETVLVCITKRSFKCSATGMQAEFRSPCRFLNPIIFLSAILCSFITIEELW